MKAESKTVCDAPRKVINLQIESDEELTAINLALEYLNTNPAVGSVWKEIASKAMDQLHPYLHQNYFGKDSMENWGITHVGLNELLKD